VVVPGLAGEVARPPEHQVPHQGGRAGLARLHLDVHVVARALAPGVTPAEEPPVRADHPAVVLQVELAEGVGDVVECPVGLAGHVDVVLGDQLVDGRRVGGRRPPDVVVVHATLCTRRDL